MFLENQFNRDRRKTLAHSRTHCHSDCRSVGTTNEKVYILHLRGATDWEKRTEKRTTEQNVNKICEPQWSRDQWVTICDSKCVSATHNESFLFTSSHMPIDMWVTNSHSLVSTFSFAVKTERQSEWMLFLPSLMNFVFCVVEKYCFFLFFNSVSHYNNQTGRILSV